MLKSSLIFQDDANMIKIFCAKMATQAFGQQIVVF